MFKVGLIKVMIVGQLTAQSIELPICQQTRAKSINYFKHPVLYSFKGRKATIVVHVCEGWT